jgi:hypothetical protein
MFTVVRLSKTHSVPQFHIHLTTTTIYVKISILEPIRWLRSQRVDNLVRLEHPWLLPVRLKQAEHFVRFQVVRLQHGTKPLASLLRVSGRNVTLNIIRQTAWKRCYTSTVLVNHTYDNLRTSIYIMILDLVCYTCSCYYYIRKKATCWFLHRLVENCNGCIVLKSKERTQHQLIIFSDKRIYQKFIFEETYLTRQMSGSEPHNPNIRVIFKLEN